MGDLYIGLMSGTSIDSVDAVIADLSQKKPLVVSQENFEIPKNLRFQTLQLINQKKPKEDFYPLDDEFAELFSNSVKSLLRKNKINYEEIIAIGSHGQTVLHEPKNKNPFSLQLGNPEKIAQKTKIKTVGNFRQDDIDKGGQGAPLSPLFHKAFFSKENKVRCILNIGGIANLTVLSHPEFDLIGYDIGPGNCLMDAWIRDVKGEDFDESGNWAKEGKPEESLLKELQNDDFFNKTSPKSTGPDYFSLNWLLEKLNTLQIKPSNRDIQATLMELTASSIVEEVNKNIDQTDSVYICGGGAKNKYLVEKIIDKRKGRVEITDELGLNSDYLEALGFAWLAKERISNKTFNLSKVTGSQGPVSVGEIFLP